MKELKNFLKLFIREKFHVQPQNGMHLEKEDFYFYQKVKADGNHLHDLIIKVYTEIKIFNQCERLSSPLWTLCHEYSWMFSHTCNLKTKGTKLQSFS